jgi:hypothetical protein
MERWFDDSVVLRKVDWPLLERELIPGQFVVFECNDRLYHGTFVCIDNGIMSIAQGCIQIASPVGITYFEYQLYKLPQPPSDKPCSLSLRLAELRAKIEAENARREQYERDHAECLAALRASARAKLTDEECVAVGLKEVPCLISKLATSYDIGSAASGRWCSAIQRQSKATAST